MRKDNPTRRDALWLALAASAIVLPAARSGGADVSPVVLPPTDELTSYLYGSQVLLRWNNVVAAAYRASPVQQFPYFSDLAGPLSGLSLTTESSEPFPHHRGLWLGCEPINGGNFWHDVSLESGHIRSIDLQLGDTTSDSAEIHNRCQWIRQSQITFIFY